MFKLVLFFGKNSIPDYAGQDPSNHGDMRRGQESRSLHTPPGVWSVRQFFNSKEEKKINRNNGPCGFLTSLRGGQE